MTRDTQKDDAYQYTSLSKKLLESTQKKRMLKTTVTAIKSKVNTATNLSTNVKLIYTAHHRYSL